MTTNTTAPSVKVGQIWKDNDPRGGRTFRIEQIVRKNTGGNGVTVPGGAEHAITVPCTSTGEALRGRRCTIRLDRFRQTKTGYKLVKDVEDQR